MAQKIPATVVTGFLGAGKTSLIRHMIENAGGKRLAFIINEFGDLGVDRELIRGWTYATCPHTKARLSASATRSPVTFA